MLLVAKGGKFIRSGGPVGNTGKQAKRVEVAGDIAPHMPHPIWAIAGVMTMAIFVLTDGFCYRKPGAWSIVTYCYLL